MKDNWEWGNPECQFSLEGARLGWSWGWVFCGWVEPGCFCVITNKCFLGSLTFTPFLSCPCSHPVPLTPRYVISLSQSFLGNFLGPERQEPTLSIQNFWKASGPCLE